MANNSNKRKQKKTKINIKETPSSNDIDFSDESTVPSNQSMNDSSSNIEPLNESTTSSETQLQFDINDNDEPSGNKVLGIIAIVLGILVIFAGFTAYRYFTDESNTESDTNNGEVASVDTEPSSSSEDANKEDDNTNASSGSNGFFAFLNNNNNEDSEGIEPLDSSNIYNASDTEEDTTTAGVLVESDSFGIDTTTTLEVDDSSSIDTSSSYTPNNGLDSPHSTNKTWTANNYDYGDIDRGEYQVVNGDTLWELSEGAYGDGTQWHKIADANNVSYLSNGNPLIVTGTTIVIP